MRLKDWPKDREAMIQMLVLIDERLEPLHARMDLL